MTLVDYFKPLPRGAKSAMAKELGVTKTWIALLIAGTRRPSAALAVQIEQYTRRAVKKKELRPDLF
jgi:DNA-binding transcriptional regulator YdaS (Cro superfamily)